MRIVQNECIVEPGDSLASIAHEFGLELSELLGLNPVTQESRLQIGQVVKLPDHIAEAIADADADELASLANQRVDRNGYPIAHGLIAHSEAKREEEKKRRPVRQGGKPSPAGTKPPKKEKDDDDDDDETA